MSVSPARVQDPIKPTPFVQGDLNRQSPLLSLLTPRSLAMDGHKEDHNTSNGTNKNEVTPNVPVPDGLSQYNFPERKLKKVLENSSKIPLLLVACGSFSPITHLHLRMFEMAADHVRHKTNYEIIGGYLSPVSDAYKKGGLASADHRLVTRS